MSIAKAATEFYNQHQGLRVQDVLENAQIVIPSVLVTPKNKPIKDVIGREVSPGDLVGISRNNNLTVVLLVGFTPDGFRVMPFSYTWKTTISSDLKDHVYSEPRVVLVHKNLNTSIAR